MNLVVTGTQAEVVTMTSLELVDFINELRKNESGYVILRHDHFMAKVPKVLGEQAAPKFSGTASYEAGGGAKRVRSIYNLPKREATLMAMSYSPEISAQVYDRMEALEKQVAGNVQQFQIPQTFHQALLLAAEQQKQIEEQQQQLTLAAPKVKFHDTFVSRDSYYNATSIAKKLGVSAYTLNNWLIAQNAMYQNRKHLKQWYIDSGYGVEKFTGSGDNVYQQCFHTSKGAEWILQNFSIGWKKSA